MSGNVDYSIRKLSSNKGAPRIWIEGRSPSKVGFEAGKTYNIDINKEAKHLILKVAESGSRKISSKTKNGVTYPVIDLNSIELLSMFDGMNCVRVIMRTNEIHILPDVVELKKQKRINRLNEKLKNGEALAIGSLCHGGGVLSNALHEGLKSAGVNSNLAFANEIREDLLAHARLKNPIWTDNTQYVEAPMQHLVIDDWMMSKLSEVDILEAGISCSGASTAGRAKNKTVMAEAHEGVGHLVAPFIQIIQKVNPAIVLLENVKQYQNTASMWILRHSLRDLGYELHEKILDSAEFNTIEKRERLCMVAVSQGINFDFDWLEVPEKRVTSVNEALEYVDPNDDKWKTFDYLLDHTEKQAEKGNGFKLNRYDGNEANVGVLGKGYGKIRSTEPKINHPTNPALMRQLTVLEHANVKGIPPALTDGLGVTLGHELLGQSVCYAPFVAVGKLIGDSIKTGVVNESMLYGTNLIAA